MIMQNNIHIYLKSHTYIELVNENKIKYVYNNKIKLKCKTSSLYYIFA